MTTTTTLTKTEIETKTGATMPVTKTHRGSCHCGAVRFEVKLSESLSGSRCNCTICTKTSMIGAIAKPAALTVTAGQDNLSWYEWGGKTARRFFCKSCGIHCFARGYLVEVGGDYVSINLNAIDDIDVAQLPLVHWDGRHNNWYAGTRPTPWPVFEAGAATTIQAT